MTRIDEVEVVIRKDHGAYVASIPELGLFARGGRAAAALDALEVKKKRLAADIEAAGGVGAFPQLPPASAAERSNVGVLGLFAAKVAIFLLLLCGAVIGSGAVGANKVHGAIVSGLGSETVGGTRFWAKVEQELDPAADPSHDLPEEKKQKLRANPRASGSPSRPVAAAI